MGHYAHCVMPIGTVSELHRWPVKSFAGETLEVVDLDARGIPGDRTHALWRRGGKRVTARGMPKVLCWSARYDAPVDGTIPLPLVTGPDGTTYRWDDDGLADTISADLGQEVALTTDEQGQQDLPKSVLVTLEPTRRLLEQELAQPVDLERFRTNIHLEVDVEPFAEIEWEGRRLRIGETELELLHPCLRCSIVTREPGTGETWGGLLKHLVRNHDSTFGINARPLGPSSIRLGDPVELL